MNEVAVVQQGGALSVAQIKQREYKIQWQREMRRRFASKHGYSTASYYATGRLRAQVLRRDDYKCVRCGMTDPEHKTEWGRPITIDHKDKNRKNNALENLQTLCLRCHGNKDLIYRLRWPKALSHRGEIMARRAAGQTYQAIADAVGLSIAVVWKWIQLWGKERA